MQCEGGSGGGEGKVNGGGKVRTRREKLTLVNPGEKEAATQKQLEEETRIAAT